MMSWQLLLTLVAASAGLVSGAWLCWPTALANPHALAWLASPPWKSEEGTSELLIAQSSQYWVGGLFLLAAFGLQVAAALASASTVFEAKYPLAIVGVVVLAISLAPLSAASFWLYSKRKARLEKALTKAAANLAANGRLSLLP